MTIIDRSSSASRARRKKERKKKKRKETNKALAYIRGARKEERDRARQIRLGRASAKRKRARGRLEILIDRARARTGRRAQAPPAARSRTGSYKSGTRDSLGTGTNLSIVGLPRAATIYYYTSSFFSSRARARAPRSNGCRAARYPPARVRLYLLFCAFDETLVGKCARQGSAIDGRG